MLAKQRRLQKKRDFKLVFNKGEVLDSELFFLRFAKNNFELSRFGFVVSLKISKKATIRNRIKRLLREVVRINLKNIKSSFDIIIIAKPGIVGKKYEEIKAEVEEFLKKAGLYI